MKPHTFRRNGFALAVSLTFVISAVLASVLPSTASAQEHRYRSDTLSSNNSAEYSYSGGDHRFGLGVSTIGGNMTTGPAALTGWIGITPDFGIQPLLDISHTTGGFAFAVGALGKYTLTRTSSSGFHVGGGLTLGSTGDGTAGVTQTTTVNGVTTTTDVGGTSSFAVGITAFFGFHFLVPGTSNITVHLDGGPVLSIVHSNANLVVESLSPGLGASVIYLF